MVVFLVCGVALRCLGIVVVTAAAHQACKEATAVNGEEPVGPKQAAFLPYPPVVGSFSNLQKLLERPIQHLFLPCETAGKAGSCHGNRGHGSIYGKSIWIWRMRIFPHQYPGDVTKPISSKTDGRIFTQINKGVSSSSKLIPRGNENLQHPHFRCHYSQGLCGSKPPCGYR